MSLQQQLQQPLHATRYHNFSTQASVAEATTPPPPHSSAFVHVPAGPQGSLFDTSSSSSSSNIGPDLVGQVGYVERTFSPQSNAQAMLTCGGPALAAHASFDPDYDRAASWIQNHAVGPAVLSPILVSGLVGALTEAAFPQAIVVQHALTLTDKPLIVGVTVLAQIRVTSVTQQNRPMSEEDRTEVESRTQHRQMGYLVQLESNVTRVQDDATIARGEQTIWIPNYKNM